MGNKVHFAVWGEAADGTERSAVRFHKQTMHRCRELVSGNVWRSCFCLNDEYQLIIDTQLDVPSAACFEKFEIIREKTERLLELLRLHCTFISSLVFDLKHFGALEVNRQRCRTSCFLGFLL